MLLLLLPVAASLLGDAINSGLRHAIASASAAHWSVLRRGPIPIAAGLLLLVPIGFCFYNLRRRNLLEAAFMVLVGVAVSMLLMVQFVSPVINRVASVRIVAQRLSTMEVQPEQVAISDVDRNQLLGLSFYMGQLLPEWNPRTSPAAIAYIIAKDTARISDTHPMAFFPGQHLRLWGCHRRRFRYRSSRTLKAKTPKSDEWHVTSSYRNAATNRVRQRTMLIALALFIAVVCAAAAQQNPPTAQP